MKPCTVLFKLCLGYHGLRWRFWKFTWNSLFSKYSWFKIYLWIDFCSERSYIIGETRFCVFLFNVIIWTHFSVGIENVHILDIHGIVDNLFRDVCDRFWSGFFMTIEVSFMNLNFFYINLIFPNKCVAKFQVPYLILV